MARRKRNQVKLAIDFGGSSTKAVATYNDLVVPLILSPEVLEVNSSDLDSYRHSNLDVYHNSFVGVGDRYFAVGELAKRLGATQALKRLKADTAVYKVLSILSILAHRLNLSRNFELELGCLLPPGEFASKQFLNSPLLEALADFDTPIGGFTAQLTEIQFYPEGLGIARFYYLNRQLTGKLGVLMAGHRNISFYTLHNKQPVQKVTSDLGFRFWVELIIERTSGYELDTLSSAVAKYWLTQEDSSLDSVLCSRESSDRDAELNHLQKVIKSTKSLYWQAVQDWLEDKLPSGIEEVMLSGGTADVLKSSFVDFFNDRLPNRPDCGNRPGIFNHQAFKLPPLDVPAEYTSRMADVYCLHEYLMPKLTTKKVSK